MMIAETWLPSPLKIIRRSGQRGSSAVLSRASLHASVELGMSRNRSGPKSAKSLVLVLETGGNGDTRWNRPSAKHQVMSTPQHDVALRKAGTVSHTIFEGTSEIQLLVIARAISDLRIE